MIRESIQQDDFEQRLLTSPPIGTSAPPPLIGTSAPPPPIGTSLLPPLIGTSPPPPPIRTSPLPPPIRTSPPPPPIGTSAPPPPIGTSLLPPPIGTSPPPPPIRTSPPPPPIRTSPPPTPMGKSPPPPSIRTSTFAESTTVPSSIRSLPSVQRRADLPPSKRRQVMQLSGRNGHKKQKMTPYGQQKINLIKLSLHEISRVCSQQMLTDWHINAASMMLQRQFPEVRCLQHTVLGQNLSFRVIEPPFVQILHVDNNHWMTIICIEDTLVKMYDSVHRSVDTDVTIQAASMIKSSSDYISFRVENTQIQKGGVDCGLFAIAYATEFCFGNCPECYRYDQTAMRQHFMACIERGEMQPFPSQLVKVKRPVKIKRVKLYCDCCLPEGGEESMAFCHKCRR